MNLKAKFSKADLLIKNVSWMMSSELLSKISRLVTVVAMAAYLSPLEYGIATLAAACHELIRVFSRAGSGARVIQCSDIHLPTVAGNASLLQWIVCILLIALQIGFAGHIASFYQNPDLQPLLVIMAFSYLCYPVVAVKVFMLQRQNRMQYFGLVCAACITIDNLSIVLFLILDHGIYAVAYAKVITAAAWVTLFGIAKIRTYYPSFHRQTFLSLCLFSIQIFTSETLRTLRSQADVLIAGRILAPELFGFYSFAKNAGVGLGQSLVAAYTSGLFPYLCSQIRLGGGAAAYFRALKFAAFLSGIFVLQSLAAPIYIDILFSSAWEGAAILVSILCLTAIPGIFIDTAASYYRALNNPFSESLLIFSCVLITTTIILLVEPSNSFELSIATASASLFWLPLLSHLFFRNKALACAATPKVAL